MGKVAVSACSAATYSIDDASAAVPVEEPDDGDARDMLRADATAEAVPYDPDKARRARCLRSADRWRHLTGRPAG
jgi:hypothetical protein